MRAAEGYGEGLPLDFISQKTFWSPSSIRRIARAAGVEIRPPGRPRIDRELVLKKLKMGEEAGLSRTGAVRFAARAGGFSESTVWRALEGE